MGNSPVTLRRPATLDHLKAKPRPERVVEIYLDQAAADAVASLEAEKGLLELRSSRSGVSQADAAAARRELSSVRKRLDAALARRDDSAVQLLLRALGRKRHDELLRAHPPTAEQEAEAEAEDLPKPTYNIKTFMPALIAATVVEPSLDAADVAALLDEWTAGETMRLWLAVTEVNNQSQLVALGKASNGTRG